MGPGMAARGAGALSGIGDVFGAICISTMTRPRTQLAGQLATELALQLAAQRAALVEVRESAEGAAQRHARLPTLRWTFLLIEISNFPKSFIDSSSFGDENKW